MCTMVLEARISNLEIETYSDLIFRLFRNTFNNHDFKSDLSPYKSEFQLVPEYKLYYMSHMVDFGSVNSRKI